MPNVLSGEPLMARVSAGSTRLDPPPMARDRSTGGSFSSAARVVGVELRLFAELREDRLQRRDLAGELTGGFAIALVLEPEDFVGQPEPGQLGLARPSWHRDPAAAAWRRGRPREMRAEHPDPAADGEAPDGSRLPVRDQN